MCRELLSDCNLYLAFSFVTPLRFRSGFNDFKTPHTGAFNLHWKKNSQHRPHPVQLLWPWQLSEIIAPSQHCMDVRLWAPPYQAFTHTEPGLLHILPPLLRVSLSLTHIEPKLILLFVALEAKLVAPATNLKGLLKEKRRSGWISEMHLSCWRKCNKA